MSTMSTMSTMSAPVEERGWTTVVTKKTKKRPKQEAIKAERKHLQSLIDLNQLTPDVVARAQALGMRVEGCPCNFAYLGMFIPSRMEGKVSVDGRPVRYCVQCLKTDNSVPGVDIPGVFQTIEDHCAEEGVSLAFAHTDYYLSMSMDGHYPSISQWPHRPPVPSSE